MVSTRKIHAAGLGVGQQVADLAGQRFNRGEVAEREVDASVVVVDRLGHVNDGDMPLARRQEFLNAFEFVSGFEGVVAADRDQCIDFERRESAWTVRSWAVRSGSDRCAGSVTCLAGIGARGPDQDPARVAGALQVGLIQHDVIAASLHRMVVAVFDQVGVTVQNAQDLDSLAAKRGRRRRDDGVRRRRRPAGEQDRHAPDRAGNSRCSSRGSVLMSS